MAVKKDKYYVRNKDKTIILETTDINEAITRANRVYKAYVLDRFGNKIHVSTMTDKENEQSKIELTKAKSLPMDIKNSGDTIWLTNAFLYRSSTAGSPSGRVSGRKYLYDAKLLNGRYRITNNINHCGAGLSFVEGYINANDIKTI